jgi:O-antigen/teichoic acid export membrane protein
VRALRALGMDGAVTCAFFARLTNIAGSAGTVLLIVHFLSPVEQGYYYTLLSLVSLQLVFELGFSFVVQQLAAHECVHLELRGDGTVSGDRTAHARLASALQLTMRWYTAAAVAMGLLLAPLGAAFFAHHAPPGAAHVDWQWPWLAAVVASMAGLWCIPYYSFIEGCGHVRAVAAMQLRQAVAFALLAWTAMVLHHGLFAPALVIAGQVVVGLHFLFMHRRLLFGLLRHKPREEAIHWRREVWPFQWRIAVSWMCSYLTVQILIPIIFALRGPVEAGQMGMSLSIAGYMSMLALAWTSTKATPFGFLIARREFQRLAQLFRRAVLQSMTAFALIAVCALAVVALLPAAAPRLAVRMVPVSLFALLVLGAAANHITQNLAVLLRSFKQEPFLGQSLVVASLNILLAAAAIPKLGALGAALSYLLATGAAGLPLAWLIYRRARRSFMPALAASTCQDYAEIEEHAAAAAEGGRR